MYNIPFVQNICTLAFRRIDVLNLSCKKCNYKYVWYTSIDFVYMRMVVLDFNTVKAFNVCSSLARIVSLLG